MRKRSNILRCFIHKGLYFVGALIGSFLFPVLAPAQIQHDTIPTQSIDTVVVRARRNVGNQFITRENIQRVPSLLGENDLIKYLATLPGVVSVHALDPGIYVRGGHSVENAYMVHGMEVANPNHLTGIISVFDPYVLGNSTFYKSGYPARYNNYLSSYINMFPTVGDKEHLKGEVTAGLLSSAIKLQGPVVNSKHSFAFSARTSYLQHVARIYNRANEDGNMPSYGFSDITLNLNSEIASRWNLNVFGLYTTDRLDIDLVKHSISHDLRWSSFSSNVRARYTGNTGVLTLSGGFNTYMTSGGSDSYTAIHIKNRYADRLAGVHYDGYVNENIHFNLGTGLSASSYDLAGQGKTDVEIYKLYGGLHVGLTEDLSLDAGLNVQHYNGRAHSNDLSPRATLNYQWHGINFRMDYARTNQYNTLYPYFTLKSPVDMHYPLAEGYKPASSSHYSLGLDTSVWDDLYLYAAFFYKKMHHAKDFLANVRSIQEDLTESFTEGRGRAKGVELDAVYDSRNLYLRATYTLSESVRRFEEINQGKEFHPPFDLKHNLLLTASFSLTSRWRLNASWTYFSGGYATFPVSIAVIRDLFNHDGGSKFIPIYRDRYNFQLPDNHRLDASVDYERTGKKVSCKWSIGAYNLYNKQNPTFIYFEPEAKDKYYTQFVPYSKVLLPFIPYASLTINW